MLVKQGDDRMIRRFIAAIALAVLSVVGLTRALQAADIRVLDTEHREELDSYPNMPNNLRDIVCNLSLKGIIEQGDLQKIKAAIDEKFSVRRSENFSVRLCLDSEGGNYLEALDIAEFLMGQYIGTGLKREAICASSCAVIFMAGTRLIDGWVGPMRDEGFDRFMHPSSTLAFHAPYLDLEGMESTPINTRWAKLAELYNDGVMATRRLTAMAMGAELRFPMELLAEMLTKGPKETYVINTVGKVTRYRIDLFDVAVPSFETPAFCHACANRLYPDEFSCDLDGEDPQIRSQVQSLKRFRSGRRVEFMPGASSNPCVIDVEVIGQTIKGWFLRPDLRYRDQRSSRGDFGSKSSEARPLPYWYLYDPDTLLSTIEQR